MEFWFGRNNLALTVFVPYDCKNNCQFCNSKAMYTIIQKSSGNVKYKMRKVLGEYSFPIKDVVFTGGEPMSDINQLIDLLDVVPDKYHVYINTTLINKNIDEFIKLVNSTNKIRGVNISRHCESYEQDCKMLNDIAPDDAVERFEKPVRINCVIGTQNIEAVLKRWADRDVELSFRKNYTLPGAARNLHNMYERFPLKLVEMGFRYVNHTQCNVCDTTRFDLGGFSVIYHKGLMNSSVLHKESNSLEVNDLIIFPDGRFAYDWGNIDAEMQDNFEKSFMRNDLSMAGNVFFPTLQRGYGYCGGGGCGGRC